MCLAKSNYGANTFYVYLVASIILYKNAAYLGGGGGKWCIRPYYLLLGGQSPPAPAHTIIMVNTHSQNRNITQYKDQLMVVI